MQPDPDVPAEAWGVLNPGCARDNGELYLFPRLVAEGNYSRIGRARVDFDESGEPSGVTRLGYALEPKGRHERHLRSQGGVEDPRVTFVKPLKCWVMAYVALSSMGPHLALAISDDLTRWRRLGPVKYGQTCGVDFAWYGNKDGMFFPDVVNDPAGRPALAMLHRPTYHVHRPDGTVTIEVPDCTTDDRESIWIGYISLEAACKNIRNLTRVYANELLATPREPWESFKIGGGTAPVRIPQGWLTFYHGVSGSVPTDPTVPKLVCYVAGAMVLDADRPNQVIYRSRRPVLVPGEPDEHHGIVSDVVFPTAVDVRENNRLDVYYGMADSRIGVATTTVPNQIPEQSN
jgi:predicted GH43/DUF377 family glycosyl hydrolase